MARLPLNNPFTEAYDYSSVEPLPQRELNMGHPTAPGYTDKSARRMGGPSPGNGQPGVPRVRTAEGHVGMSIPGSFGRPISPGSGYEGEDF